MKQLLCWGLLACALFYAGLGQVRAGALVTVDENGNGTITTSAGTTPLSSGVGNDPGPGGLNGVLIYQLPYFGVQGDVFMTDANFGGIRLDVVRFNGDGTLIFYSDNVDGFDALADTPSPPGTIYANLVSVPEVQGLSSVYTPGPNDPGYDPNFLPTYTLISDVHVEGIPEPASLTLLGLGAVGVTAGYAWRRRRAAKA